MILNSCSCIHVTISSRIQDDDDDGEKDEHGEDLGSSRKAEEKEACMNSKKKEEVVDSISPANSGPTCIHSMFWGFKPCMHDIFMNCLEATQAPFSRHRLLREPVPCWQQILYTMHACYNLSLLRRNSTRFAKHWESGKNFGLWWATGTEERLDEGTGRTRKSSGEKVEDRWIDEDVSSPKIHAWRTMHEWWALHAWDPEKHGPGR